MPPKTKLTEAVVAFARRRTELGANTLELADAFGIDVNELTDAIRGHTFAHLLDPPPVSTLKVAESSKLADPDSPTRFVTKEMRLNGKRLKAIREQRLLISQRALAQRINRACMTLGYEDPHCTKRLVQKWENGEHGFPLPRYQHALMIVTNESIHDLCTPIEAANLTEAEQRLARIIATAQTQHHRLINELMDLHAYLAAEPLPFSDDTRENPAEDAKDVRTRKPRAAQTQTPAEQQQTPVQQLQALAKHRAEFGTLLDPDTPPEQAAILFGVTPSTVRRLRDQPDPPPRAQPEDQPCPAPSTARRATRAAGA
jgi:transcriptional regulator with XRE-family HTH domain